MKEKDIGVHMFRTCVVHLTPVEGSMQASARVARWLATAMGVPLIDDAVSLDFFLHCISGHPDDKPGHRDVTVFFVNGPIAFCGFRDEMGKLLLPRVRRVVWVQQDYTITLPPNQAYSRPTKAETPFRAEFHKIPHVHLWSTCIDVLAKRQDKQVPGCEYVDYVNWNALTYAPMPKDWHQNGERLFEMNSGLFYYGALRAGRVRRLIDLLSTNAPVTIGASNLNARTAKEWELIAPNAQLRGPTKGEARYVPTNRNTFGYSAVILEIAMYRHSLYVADDESNTAFHSLANRFYEVLSTPLTVLWLDAAGAATYDRAGLQGWERFAVKNANHVAARLRMTNKELTRMAEEQRALWLSKDPYKQLKDQLKDIVKFVKKEWKL
jgi:hypothetical protein